MRLRSAGEWVKVNADQLGFYRVNYPPLLWERLAAAARSTAVIDTNGAQLHSGIRVALCASGQQL